MTTFKQFIHEQDDEVVDLEVWLDKHCDPFLSELGDDEDSSVFETATTSLFRGMSLPTTRPIKAQLENRRRDFYIKNTRKDRIPVDTHIDISEMIDVLFNQQFGWKPRSQGMFCVGRSGRGSANFYGDDVFAVMPMGKFKYLWSPKIFDLTVQYKEAFRKHNVPVIDVGVPYTKEQLNLALPVLQEIVSTYKSTDLGDALNTRNEIMIYCDQYAAIRK